MDIEALLEQYVSENADKEKYVRTVVCAFSERGIEQPTETDYKETLKGYLQEKCITGKSSYYNYRSAGKDFYAWIGDKIMDTELESEVTDVTATRETEPPKTENESVQADFDMKQKSDTSEVLQNKTETDTGKSEPEKDPDKASKKEQNITVQASTKRGRKTKAENEKSKREQISLYVDSDIYAKLKDIAQFKKMNVSDILCIAMKDIVDRNYEKIQRIQQYIESENIEI